MEGIMIDLYGQISSQHQANVEPTSGQRRSNVELRPMGDIYFGMCHRRWPEIVGITYT